MVLDEWPWLKPYIEIEGYSKGAVQVVAEKLGFKWSNAVFGSVMTAYRTQYPWLKRVDGKSLGYIENVRFGDPFLGLMKK